MTKKQTFIIHLKDEDKERLNQYIRRGKASARSLTRARILLLADEGRSTEEIIGALKISRNTINRIRKRHCLEGLSAAIGERSRSGRPPKIDGRIEAKTTLLACSQPPEGRSTWTLKLIADKLVELEVIDSISPMSVQRILKKGDQALAED
jgi:transposase